eukprot:gene20704-24812_t
MTEQSLRLEANEKLRAENLMKEETSMREALEPHLEELLDRIPIKMKYSIQHIEEKLDALQKADVPALQAAFTLGTQEIKEGLEGLQQESKASAEGQQALGENVMLIGQHFAESSATVDGHLDRLEDAVHGRSDAL